MVLQHASHAPCGAKCHPAGVPKYRRWVFREPKRDGAGEPFKEAAEHHGFEIKEMEIAIDHVHIFLSFPPRCSIANAAGMLKSISAREIFEVFPKVKKQLWGGGLWEAFLREFRYHPWGPGNWRTRPYAARVNMG